MNNKKKILISCKSFGKTGSKGCEILTKAGLEPIMNSTGKRLNEEEIINMGDRVVGIIAGTEKISKKVITALTTLKVISRYGVGMDSVDLDTARQKGIEVFNTPDAPTEAVAELALSMIFSLLRKICMLNFEVHGGTWKPQLGSLLSRKTVGIMGLGKIGRKVIQLLEPFGVKILGFEQTPDPVFIAKYNISIVAPDALLSQSDIISLHLPSTTGTHHILGEKEFSKMKKTSILINTARGNLIDEKALYIALKNRTIAGAGLDVFENEPRVGKLKDLDNAILTPHIGSSTVETRENMDIESAINLINGLKKMGIL